MRKNLKIIHILKKAGNKINLPFRTAIFNLKLKNDKTYDEKAVMAGGEPMVINQSNPTVKGVIVTADGADDIKIKRQLTEAVSAVLKVEPHKICIYKRK